MLNAAIAHGHRAFGVVAVSDQSDGFYFLKHTFPPDESRADVFDAMSSAAQSDTGIDGAVIREKPVPLPDLPVRKTADFFINDWPSNGVSMAELSEKMKLMDRHFVSLQGMKQAIIVQLDFYEGTDVRSAVVPRTVAETKLIFNSSIFIITEPATERKKQQTRPLLDMWLERPDRPVKKKVDFLATAAERDANPKVLSSFTGLYFDTTEPMTHADAAEHHGVQTLRNYIFQILADGNQASYDYIIGWLAAGLQRLKKLGVILVLVGAPGAGKSHLFSECDENHPIFQTVYGGVDGYFMSGQGIDDLIARFNVMSSSKLFAVSEELESGSAKQNMDKLKNLAAATYVTFEGKYTDATPQLDRRNFVCLTNHEDALGADGMTGDVSRKFAVFEASDKFSKAKRDADSDLDLEAWEFFREADDAQADPDTQRAFYWFLKTLNLDSWNAYSYPQTPILKRYRAGANAIPTWLAELTSGDTSYGTITWPLTGFRSSYELFGNFTAWCKIHAPANKDPFKSFTNQLAKFAQQHPNVLTPSNPGGKSKGYKLLAAWQLDP